MKDGTLDPDLSHRAGAVLTVDLAAIVQNWRSISADLAPGCQAGAVVKADSYGLGAQPIAGALAAAGCRRFFVATLDEALSLRTAQPDIEILVMNGLMPGHEEAYRRHRLIPMLASLAEARAWKALAEQNRQTLPAALHIDTGMSRLGMDRAAAATLATDAAFNAAIDLLLIASHLACADDPDSAMNGEQISAFQDARRLFPGVPGSLAASSGIFLGVDYHAEWVRPGAALYGIAPHRNSGKKLAAVVRLQATILQVRAIDAPESVGYGASFRATGKTRLATVAIGYADGVLRSLSNRGFGFIGDKRVPLVGRVSMDLTVFDVTGVDERSVMPGQAIDLIGPHQSVDDLADQAGTIGYEILTSLGPRIHRHYVTDALK
jgi:alanine racemase